jgi:diketogulonate reductase-like aldo/keto reductase
MTPTTQIPSVPLNNGVEIPQLGFGVFQVPPAETAAAVSVALEAGYRHSDTAVIYDNEAPVGEALAASGLPRDELFVTTKVWNADQGRDATLRSFEHSLARLKLDYLDLFLIHWPAPGRDRYVETWQALEQLHGDGRVRAIGVSNFQPAHLDRLATEAAVVPAVNQIELHPYLQQANVRAADTGRGIVTEASSPLAQGSILDDPVLARIAAKHDTDVAQVALAWNLQLGNVVLTKSVTPERIRQNLDALTVPLDDADHAAIAALDRGGRVGPDPDLFNG